MSEQNGRNVDSRFASIGRARRAWAIGSIDGHLDALNDIHRQILETFKAGDRLVYLGNVPGQGLESAKAIDSVLLMRRHALAHPGGLANDVVFLRGNREEMTDKFMHLHMAIQPLEVFDWMCDRGLESILSSYGLNVAEARKCCERGAKEIAQFVKTTRDAMANHDGHWDYFTSLRQAAFDENRKILFVSAGLDPQRPLDTQDDELWWGGEGFDSINAPFGTFQRIVRGTDPKRRGAAQSEHVLTLDPGAPGSVRAALIDAEGAVLSTLLSSPDRHSQAKTT